MKPIVSLRELQYTLGVPRKILRDLAANAPAHYHPFPRKQGVKVRTIDNPDTPLKHVQRRINRRILDELPVPAHVHGGVHGRSPLSNALAHEGCKTLVRIDVRDFFPSITNRHVYRFWSCHLGFGTAVSKLLTELTTYRFRLPQGAPTSTALANHILAVAEAPVMESLRMRGLTVTRFVDDIGVSGPDPRSAIQDVVAALRSVGLRSNRSKLNGRCGIMGPTSRRTLTGYTLAPSGGTNVAQEYQNNVRMAIYNLWHLDPASSTFARQYERVKGQLRFIQGSSQTSETKLRRDMPAAPHKEGSR